MSDRQETEMMAAERAELLRRFAGPNAAVAAALIFEGSSTAELREAVRLVDAERAAVPPGRSHIHAIWDLDGEQRPTPRS